MQPSVTDQLARLATAFATRYTIELEPGRGNGHKPI
jgi:hypothetical protein